MKAIRGAILLLACAAISPAWVESVEFPWNACPRQLWEGELAWLKNIGVTHISLPPAAGSEREGARLSDVIQMVRRLDLEADLEGPVPEDLMPLTRAHGGPLTDPLPGGALKISVLDPVAITKAREGIAAGAPALLWRDAEDTLAADGYHAGGVAFDGQERPAAAALRRDAGLTRYWGKTFSTLKEMPRSKAEISIVSVRQFVAGTGVSLVSVVNDSATAWTGEVKAGYPALKRTIVLPGVAVPAHDALWLPVNVPLTAGPLCKDCSAFANTDHLIYATAELTAIEYENGILAMEFSAPAKGEAVLQLSQEPYGPFVAGGRPRSFDWDEHELRARLEIPAGTGPAHRVRIGLAIEPPDATAFFDKAAVLLIGETNRLLAKFSSEAIAGRSRLRMVPPFRQSQEATKEPLELVYSVTVPDTALHGDHAELAIEADGIQMTHASPQLMRPASLRFADAIDVHLTPNSALPLFPATVPVNQRTGREITVSVRNNAPEIRNFHLEMQAEGLEFSPAKMDFSVGASTARDVTFRVFAKDAGAGSHGGEARLSWTAGGAASKTEPVQFVVIPQGGAARFSGGEFSLVESARYRATFLPGRWLELVDKDNNRNLLPGNGVASTEAQKVARPEDLLPLTPQAQH
ncbi:MAG TPA: hypothetical protein VG273_04630 [Bryobacteraceae bacterium]|jgi:hypothetical protein|nr:hypothetical protein [Bryobacteraceae bacterium]